MTIPRNKKTRYARKMSSSQKGRYCFAVRSRAENLACEILFYCLKKSVGQIIITCMIIGNEEKSMRIKRLLTILATVMMFLCVCNMTAQAEDEIMQYAPYYDATTKAVVGAPEVGTLISQGTVFSGENISEDINIIIRTYDTEQTMQQKVGYESIFLWNGDQEATYFAGPNGDPEGGWIVSKVYYIEEVMEWGDVLNRIYIEGYAAVPPTEIESVDVSVNWDKIGYFRIGKALPRSYEGLVEVANDSCNRICDFGLYLKATNNHVQKGYVSKKNYENAVSYSGGWLDMACLTSSYKVSATDEFCYRFDVHAAEGNVFTYADNTNVKNKITVATSGASVNSAVANYNDGEDNVCLVMLYLGTAQNMVDRAGITADDIYVGWKKFGDKWCYFDENGNQTFKQWVKTSKGWCYIDADGYMATNKWVEDANGTCYVDENGYMVTNKWIQSEWGDWQYVNENGYLAKNIWVKDANGWRYLGRYGWVVTDTWIDYEGERYYVDETGYMVTNRWFNDANGWFYLGSEGYIVKNQRANDTRGICFVGEDGYMVYGQWVKDTKGWSYVGSNGYIAVNKWMQSGSKWCYVGEDGYMVTNEWVKDSKGFCFVGTDGYIVYGKWVKDSKGWGYAGTDGYRVFNKWIKDYKGWCYVGEDGYMAVSKWIQDSKGWCYVEANGYMATNKWVKDYKGWCYVGSNGYMVTNKWIKDAGKWSYADANGYRVTNEWVKDRAGWCYLDADGFMVYSKWIKIDSNWYYVNASGYRVTGWLKINNVWYYFKADGVMAADECIKGYCFDKNGAWIA